MSTPTTKNESKISKRLLMKRAKAKIAKYNAEQQQFKVVLPETPLQMEQESIRDPPEETKTEIPSLSKTVLREQPPLTETAPSPINEFSSKISEEPSSKTTPEMDRRPVSESPTLPTAISEIKPVAAPKEEVPAIVKSKSRDSCRGIVGQRAALWQQRQGNHQSNRADPPGQGVIDYDEYVKSFQKSHRRETKFRGNKQ